MLAKTVDAEKTPEAEQGHGSGYGRIQAQSGIDHRFDQ